MIAFRRDIALLPNRVTLARIALVLVAAAVFMSGHPLHALLFGIPAGLSDYLDGYLARKRGEVTALGALLDSLADTLFALVCLVMAAEVGVWPAYLIVLWGIRDMTVMTLRSSAGLQGFTLPSSFLGKLAWNFDSYSFVIMGLDAARPFASPELTAGIHWLGLAGIHAGILMQWIAGGLYVAEYARRYRG
jgi:cardiolipin synthase